MLKHTEPPQSAALVPLDVALAPYPHVSRLTLRGMISRGEIAATMIGRALFVDPRELDARFCPQRREPSPIVKTSAAHLRALRDARLEPDGGVHRGEGGDELGAISRLA
jgi:hypothetical protein